MAMTFDDVDEVASKLPGVTVGLKWATRTWMVDGKGFAWQRPFSKADLKRFGDETPPAGEILAVRVESLDAKDALLAMAFAQFALQSANALVAALFYAIAGLGWVLPAMPVVSWMQRPDRS